MTPAILYALSKQLPTARAIKTDYGEIELDEEMRSAIEAVLAPILSTRLGKLDDRKKDGIRRETIDQVVGKKIWDRGLYTLEEEDLRPTPPEFVKSIDDHFWEMRLDEPVCGCPIGTGWAQNGTEIPICVLCGLPLPLPK